MAAPPAGGSDPGLGASGRSFRALTATPAIISLLLVGLALRVIIAYVLFPGSGFESDIGTFTAWALKLAEVGPGRFYATAGFADYPPGYLVVLWVVGVIGRTLAPTNGAGDIVSALIKVPPMLADIGVGYLLYRITRWWLGDRRNAVGLALAAAALYVFNPVTFYDSALWGQVDAVGALVFLATIVMLFIGLSEGAAGMAVLAGLIKPQYGVVLVPIVAVVLLRRHLLKPGSGPIPARLVGRFRGWFVEEQGAWRLVSSATVGAIVLLVFIVPFSLDLAGFITLISKTAGGYPYLSVNAYNPWALIGAGGTPSMAESGQWSKDTIPLLGPLSGVAIGGVLLAIGFLVGLGRLALRDDRRSIVLVTAYLSLAFFILPTRVHERYLFPVFVLLPLLAVQDRRWRIATVVLAIASFMNLHGVLTTPLYATPNVDDLPFGELFRSQLGITVSALLHTGVFAFVLWRLRPSVVASAAVARSVAFVRRRPLSEPDVPIAALAPDVEADGRPPFDEGDVWSVDEPRAAGPGSSVDLPGGHLTPGLEPSLYTGERRWAEPPVGILGRLRARLRGANVRRDRTAELVAERGGKLQRLDLLLVVLVFLATLGLRTFRLSEPYDMHFDEVYHARTATEFLQDWRYGIDHSIYEYTHPHMAKYLIALGLIAFGNDQVTGQSQLGVPVKSAVVEPRWSPEADPAERDGDRLYVATGQEVHVYDLRDRGEVATLRIAAVGLRVAENGHRLYMADAYGGIWRFDTTILDRQRFGRGLGEHLTPIRIASFDAVAADFTLADDEKQLVAVLQDGQVRSVDADTGVETGATTRTSPAGVVDAVSIKRVVVDPTALLDVASAAKELATALKLDEATVADQLATTAPVTIATAMKGPEEKAVQKLIDDGLTGVSIESGNTVAVSESKGVALLDAKTLEEVSFVQLPAAGRGLVMERGLDDPMLYVATGRQIERIRLPSDAEPSKESEAIKMPNEVRDLYWDKASNLVHALGTTQDGTADTVYVIEPHGNAVFADARLPFPVAAVALDFQPQRPSDDRQDILAFSATGDLASIDSGSNAFGWRISGVIMGGILAVCLFLLARILFRRRSVAVLVSIFALADGMFFANSRIAMNDIYVSTFVVAAFTVFAPLYLGIWRSRRALLLGMPAVAVLLGLALASKWVGAYALGGVVLAILLRSALGRLIALAGMIAATAVLGLLAISADPAVADANRNFVFLLMMVGLTLALAVLMVVRPVRFTAQELRFAVLGPSVVGVGLLAVGLVLLLLGSAPPAAGSIIGGRNLLLGGGLALIILGNVGYLVAWLAGRMRIGPLAPAEADLRSRLLGPSSPAPDGWLRPGSFAGLPWLFALACLVTLPFLVYIVSYAPWVAINNNQWGLPILGSLPFLPHGGTGQTLLDLTKGMYDYHNELRATHPASSPWWAWPFDLKPVWFYQEGFANKTTGVIYDSGNLVLFWLSFPAVAFAAFQAWRRRSQSLTLVVIAIAVMWLPWARIDRATFQYHIFTTLPFSFMALAYFMADLWHGPSWRTWLLARVAAAVTIVGAPLLWIGRGTLCGLAGVEKVHPGGQACGTVTQQFTVTASTAFSAIALLVGVGIVIWQLVHIARQRREIGSASGVPLPSSIARLVRRDALPAVVLPGLTLVVTAFVVVLASRAGEKPIFQGPLGASGPAVIAIPALLALAVVAFFALGARDSRRWVAGVVGAAVLWFVVWYPNISGLPLPDAIANNYLMTLPTYNYDFQFAVNTDALYKTGLIRLDTVLFMLFLGATVLAAMYATYAWRLELAARRAGANLGPPPVAPAGPVPPVTPPPEPGAA